MTTTTDQIAGLNGFVAWKPPVVAATTANITLAGEQTIDGVSVTAGDRVLAKDQTTGAENGIWICAASAWSRSRDFNGARDVINGTAVFVVGGTVNALSLWYLSTSGDISIGSTSLSFAEIVPQRGAYFPQEYGTGADGFNAAITAANSAGGGVVLMTGDTTLSARIVMKDGVTLDLGGHTLTLGADLGSLPFIKGTDTPGAQVRNGKIVLDGLTTGYAIEFEGASNYPVEGIEITEHKSGVRIEANATSGIGYCVIRDLYVHDNYVHPTSPSTLSGAGHALSISCRPSVGYDLTEKVTLENVRLEGVATGATNGTNQYTKDLLSVQGAKIVWCDNVISRRSGEVGLTFSFGCQQVSIANSLVEDADGHGILMSGAHYRIDVSSVVGTFQVGETVTGGTSSATGVVEYLNGTVIGLQSPSRAKIAAGETVTGGTSTATATVDSSWYALKFDVDPSVKTKGNGIDANGLADYAGLTAQHVEEARMAGTHVDNKPYGITVNSSDYMIGETHIPVSATQTERISQVGSSTFLGRALSPASIADPTAADGDDQDHFGFWLDATQRLTGVGNEAESVVLNRTGASGNEYGAVVQIARNSTIVGEIGTDGIQFPQNTATGAFSHSTLPAAAAATRSINYSSSSRGGSPALVRSDGAEHIDLVTGLKSRSSAWTKTLVDAETGTIVGGAVYVSDGADGLKSLSVWDGSAWLPIALNLPTGIKSGVGTIADTATTEAISFSTDFGAATYAVITRGHGNEEVWPASIAVGGFTATRSGSSGALDFSWIAIPATDP